MTTATTQEIKTPRSIIALIVIVSALASAFIFWLVYFHTPVDVSGTQLHFLPALNAVLNAFAAVALFIGFNFIRARKVAAHRTSMLVAFVFSAMFLVSYLANYALHGEYHLPIPHVGAFWWSYLLLLLSHILLSVIALPMVLITFFLSLTGRFPAHKKLARWTFPIWLYVSVTGVIVFLMQAATR